MIPEEPELAHPLHRGVGEARLAVALGRDGLDLLLGELPSEALDHLLLVRQLEPHAPPRGQALTSGHPLAARRAMSREVKA